MFAIDVYTAARIGSYLSFHDLMAWEAVYQDTLTNNPFGWNAGSRGAAIQWGHPCIYTSGFYGHLKPASLVKLMKKGLENGKDNKTIDSIMNVGAMVNHLTCEGHKRNGDRTWTLVLTALRYQRWTTVPKLIDKLLWSPRYFEDEPYLSPHIGVDALNARTFTPATPSRIKVQMALVLNLSTELFDSDSDDALVQVLNKTPCLTWGKTIIWALAQLPEAKIGMTNQRTPSCECGPSTSETFVKKINQLFHSYSLDQRLAIVDSLIDRNPRRHEINKANAALWMWRTIVDFLDTPRANQRLPSILGLLDRVVPDLSDIPFAHLAPFLPESFFENKIWRYLQMPYYLKGSLAQFYAHMYAKRVPLYWRPEWSYEPIGKQAARLLQRIVQIKKHKPLYFFRATTMPVGLWAEMVCVTTPPPLPHFALEWTEFRVAPLTDDHARIQLRFDSKPLWDFSSGLQTMALGCDSSGHWALEAKETYNALADYEDTQEQALPDLFSLLRSLTGTIGGGRRRLTRYPDYKQGGTKIYWGDLGLRGWLDPSKRKMTLELFD